MYEDGHLGLHTLAVTHYEKVLQLVEGRKDDVSPEAFTFLACLTHDRCRTFLWLGKQLITSP